MATKTAQSKKLPPYVEEPKAPPELVYPEVAVGDIVHWYHGSAWGRTEDVEPILALVTRVFTAGMLGLSWLPHDNPGFSIGDDSIRHVSDPQCARLHGNDPDFSFWMMPPNKLTLSEIRWLKENMPALRELVANGKQDEA